MKTIFQTLALLFALGFGSGLANADTHVWNDPGGGVWGTFTKWTPLGLPSSLDVARFNLNTGSNYTVSFIQDRQARLLQVLNSDVTFESSGIGLGDRTLSLEDAFINTNAEVLLTRGNNDKKFTLSTSDDMTVRGSLVVDNGAELANQSAVVDSALSNETAFLFVESVGGGGERSTWNAISLDVGANGNGTVHLVEGGLAQINGPTGLGAQSDSFGEVVVTGRASDGTKSDFRSAGTITIGGAGRGSLRVQRGGFAATGGAILGDSAGGRGTATIGNDLPGNPSYWIAGELSVKRGDVAVNRGGSLRTFGASIGTADTSSVTVSGSGTVGTLGFWEAQNLTRIGVSADATLEIQNGGTVSGRDFAVGTIAGDVARINVSSSVPQNESHFLLSGDLHLGGDDSGAGGLGHLNLNTNSFARIRGATTIYDNSSILMGPNSTLVADSIDNSKGGFFDFLRGTLHMRNYTGDLVNQEGTLAPYRFNSQTGEGAGDMFINGDYTQQVGATLAIEVIDDSGCGIGYDHLDVSGNGVLGGTLELSLADGFVPDALSVFNILAADSLSGQFANIAPGERLTTVDGRGSFVVNYGNSSPFNADNVFLTDFQLLNGYPGDFDGNESVDGRDFLLWQRNDGSPSGLAAWETNYGTSAPAISALTTAVPEPASVGLFVLGTMTLFGLGRVRDQG